MVHFGTEISSPKNYGKGRCNRCRCIRQILSKDHARLQANEQITAIGKRRLILLLRCLVYGTEEMKNFSIADKFMIHDDDLHDFEASPGSDVPSLEEMGATAGHFLLRDNDIEGFRIYPDRPSAIVAFDYSQGSDMGMEEMRPYSICSHC